jgi:hypothetical protein
MKSKNKRIDWQKRTKEEHKDRILTLLGENKTMRFKDFRTQSERTGIKSEKGLSEVLQRLQDEGLIEKTHIDIEIEKGEPERGPHGEILKKNIQKKKVEAYRLTEKGQKYQAWWLIHELFELKDKNSGYFHSIGYKYASFGLSEDIVIGRATDNKLSNFDIPAIPEIEDFIMLATFKKIREGSIKPEYDDHKLLLSFEIDFAQLTRQIMALQVFIEDINTGQDVFSDKRLGLQEQTDKLWLFNLFINYSVLLGDEKYKDKLTIFLKNFSNSQQFYDITQVDSKLFKSFMKCVEQDKSPLKDKKLFNSLIIPVERGIGYYNLFVRYVAAAKIIKYGNKEFDEKLDELNAEVSKKTSEMSMSWAIKEQKKFEAKQKGAEK